MRLLPLIFVFLAMPVFGAKVVSFEASKIYKIEGTLKGHFFIFNGKTSNVQMIELKSKNEMVDGAQYAACLKFTTDCHMECKAEVKGTPKFITPDLNPALLTPDEKGAYAPADKTQCP